MNPGPWTEHSRHAAEAAEYIAAACGDLNCEKAFVCGLLHDIGRRAGVSAVRHIVDGYDYCLSKGWDEVARVCLTHSFPVKDIRADIGKKDIDREQYDFVDRYLKSIEYDDYDKLIILCDALADARGFVSWKRDLSIRRGGTACFPFRSTAGTKLTRIRNILRKRRGLRFIGFCPASKPVYTTKNKERALRCIAKRPFLFFGTIFLRRFGAPLPRYFLSAASSVSASASSCLSGSTNRVL